jgi:hypothetical protein
MSLLELFTLSNHLLKFSALLVALVSLQQFRNRPIYIKLIFTYASISFSIGLIQELSKIYFNNYYMNELGSFFVLCEMIFICLIYHYVIKEKSINRIPYLILFVYVLTYVISILLLKENYYSIIRFGRDIGLMMVSVLYFYYLMRFMPEQNLLKDPMFWISAAILLHFSFTLILSFLMSYLMKNYNSTVLYLWIFRNILRILFYLILGYAVRLEFKNKLLLKLA